MNDMCAMYETGSAMCEIHVRPTSTMALPSTNVIVQALLVGAIVFVASLGGILARPVGFLSSFWPANAILLGLMVRNPSFAHPLGWVCAAAGYIAADLATGGAILPTLWLTLGNLTSAATGFVLFMRRPLDDRQLRSPLAILHLLCICLAASAATAVVTAGALVIYFGRDLLDALAISMVLELATHLIILPMFLTAPPSAVLFRRRRAPDNLAARLFERGGPLAALVLSLVIGSIIGGPGASMFPMPAILWCALSYGRFFTATMMCVVGLWQSMMLYSLLQPGSEDFLRSIVSFRLGSGLFALGPLMVASINAARNDLVVALDRAANQDPLTLALTRRAFLERADAALAADGAGAACLLLDIDYFKQINDRHGHAAGDAVLAQFGSAVRNDLRDDDLFGRLGGEEFAVLLKDAAYADAMMVAERLRKKIETMQVDLETGETVAVTVSIGIAFHDVEQSLTALLSHADQALYEAKHAGRNRIVRAAAVDA